MFVGFQQLAVNATVSTVTAITWPSNTVVSQVALQADVAGSIRYTMDGVSVPNTSVGMILAPNTPPQLFLAEEIQNIKYVAGTANTNILLHYHK